MVGTPTPSAEIGGWLQRLQAGDLAALDGLIRHSADRLRQLTRRMLGAFPGVHRWAETDDVLQNALVRLLRALEAVHPTSAREFLGLAAEQVRRELIDLARHYYGPEGLGANHGSRPPEQQGSLPEPADLSHEPGRLAEWSELHRHIGALPAEEREVVDLLFYQGLPQAEVAELLGVTVRTVQRRWQAALLRLHRVLKGQWPGS
jgi:RNA polymerase sigma-70 factor (ECF subfamily)